MFRLHLLCTTLIASGLSAAEPARPPALPLPPGAVQAPAPPLPRAAPAPAPAPSPCTPAPQRAPAAPGRAPCPCGSVQDGPGPRPTRLQIDVFEIKSTRDQIASFELDRLAAGDPPPQEVRERLMKFGLTTILARFDQSVDLTSESNLTRGRRVPTIQDITVGKDGRTTPSVNYNQIGVNASIRGRWRDNPEAMRADVTFTMELSNVSPTPIEVTSGVKLPSFNQIKFRQHLIVDSGKPILLMSSDLPVPDDKTGETIVTIVRIALTQMAPPAPPAPPPAGAVRGGQPTSIRVDVIEFTYKPGDVSDDETDILPTVDDLDEGLHSLSRFGEAKVLMRPQIRANWPEQSTISIGERVPIVRAASVAPSGEATPNADHRNVGLDLKIDGKWRADGRVGDVDLDLCRTTMGKKRATIASGVDLPTFIERKWSSGLRIGHGKPMWILCGDAQPAAEHRMTRTILRLVATRG